MIILLYSTLLQLYAMTIQPIWDIFCSLSHECHCLYFSASYDNSQFSKVFKYGISFSVDQKEPSSDVSSPSSPRLSPPTKRTRRQTASEPSSSDTSPSPQTKGQRVSWDIPTYSTRSAHRLFFLKQCLRHIVLRHHFVWIFLMHDLSKHCYMVHSFWV